MSEDIPCPHCGTTLSVGGTFCKECGYDEAYEYADDAYLDGVDLPDTSEPDLQFALHGVRSDAPGRRPAIIVLVIFLVIGLIGPAFVYWLFSGM